MTVIASDKAWSFSALNNFETCPKKFYHLSVAKDYKEVEGEALVYGKHVHKALEHLVKNSTPLPQDLAHLLPYVQKFIDFPGTKRTEQQLAITKQFKVTDWRDWKGAWCRVVIDLALIGEYSGLLIDYKTGKMKDDGFTQLKLAAAIKMLHNPKLKILEVGYLWTQHNGAITKETYTRAQTTEIWNDILPRVNRFQEAHRRQEYPPRPSGLCRKHCIVTGCPHHGVG